MTTCTTCTTCTTADGVLCDLASRVFAQPWLRAPQLAALRAHDASHGSCYVETLRTYLDAQGGVGLTAARLGVHVNTLRYRVARLARVARLDLDDPDQRLVCELELRAAPAGPVLVPEPAGCVTVVAFRVLGDDAGATCGLARTVAAALRASVWCDVADRTVYASVPSGDVEAATRRAVTNAACDLGVPVVAGIGPAVDAAHGDTSRRLADEVLRAVARRGGDPVARVEDVRTDVVLASFAGLAPPDLDGGAVERLAAHDRLRGTEYVASLRAYLDAFGDVPRAAAAAFVHVRTFRYRLLRVADIGGLRLDDPAQRLAVHLALRLR